MFPGGHGQAPGPPSQTPGPIGAPGSGGDGWNPIQGIGSSGTGLGLGQTMLPGPGPLGQLGMSGLGTIISNPGTTGSTSSTGSVSGAMMASGSGAPSNISPIGSGSLTPPGDASTPHFLCPRRPNLGREGRPIMLRANHFQVYCLITARKNIVFLNVSSARFPCPEAISTTT